MLKNLRCRASAFARRQTLSNCASEGVDFVGMASAAQISECGQQIDAHTRHIPDISGLAACGSSSLFSGCCELLAHLDRALVGFVIDFYEALRFAFGDGFRERHVFLVQFDE